VEHSITGHHIDHEAVRRAIELSEGRDFGAGAMLGKVAELRHMYCIVEVGMPELAVALSTLRAGQNVILPARRAFRMTTTSMASCKMAPAAGMMKPKAAKSMAMTLRPMPTQIPWRAMRNTWRPRRTARATHRISVESNTVSAAVDAEVLHECAVVDCYLQQSVRALPFHLPVFGKLRHAAACRSLPKVSSKSSAGLSCNARSWAASTTAHARIWVESCSIEAAKRSSVSSS